PTPPNSRTEAEKRTFDVLHKPDNFRSSLHRLNANKDELLRVLERPEIPLNANASDDIRTVVTKRKVSGGTVGDKGRAARDVMLGLAKTCAKLKIPFFHCLGVRLQIPGPQVPPLASLIAPTPS
ncbi:MAG TPA: hypothetical protein VEH77_10565, partial [Roseiarcus sp.]|nr:hypothetical protein [Roseiarcus sp.]